MTREVGNLERKGSRKRVKDVDNYIAAMDRSSDKLRSAIVDVA